MNTIVNANPDTETERPGTTTTEPDIETVPYTKPGAPCPKRDGDGDGIDTCKLRDVNIVVENLPKRPPQI